MESTGEARPQRHFANDGGRNVKSDSLTRTEKTLLRLITIDGKYAAFPDDLAGKVFTSPADRSIYKSVAETEGAAHPLTMDTLGSAVDPEYLKYADEIMAIAIPADREQQTYDECVGHIRTRILKERAAEISNQLEMGDGILSDEDAEALMIESIEIQRKIIG